MDQPKTTAYIVDEGEVTKLTQKANAQAATIWASDIYTYTPAK
jgi:hypothetical protein